MTQQQQPFDAKCEQTITEMMPFVTYLAKGDPDLIQTRKGLQAKVAFQAFQT